MNTIDVVENKISATLYYLNLLGEYKVQPLKKFQKDLMWRGALERYLYLVVQATIDLAEAFIAFKKLRKPTTYGEAFEILQEQKIIPETLTENLIKMVGFRNIVTHDYARIDLGITYDVLQNRLKDIEKFIKTIKEKL